MNPAITTLAPAPRNLRFLIPPYLSNRVHRARFDARPVQHGTGGMRANQRGPTVLHVLRCGVPARVPTGQHPRLPELYVQEYGFGVLCDALPPVQTEYGLVFMVLVCGLDLDLVRYKRACVD